MQESLQSKGSSSKETPLKIFATINTIVMYCILTPSTEAIVFSPALMSHRMIWLILLFCLVNELLAGCSLNANSCFPRCISRHKCLWVNFSTPDAEELLAQIKSCKKNRTESTVTNLCKTTLGRHIYAVASSSCLSCSFRRSLLVRFCLLVL